MTKTQINPWTWHDLRGFSALAAPGVLLEVEAVAVL
jgi:hypothetical protein